MNLSSQTLPIENRLIIAYKVFGHRAVEDPDFPQPVQLQFLLRFLAVDVGQVYPSLVVLVEHDPAMVIDSVGDGHQRLVDVRHLEHAAVTVPFIRLKCQVYLADLTCSMMYSGHRMQSASRACRQSDLLGVNHPARDDRVACARVRREAPLQLLSPLLEIHRTQLDLIGVALHEALGIRYARLLEDRLQLALGQVDVEPVVIIVGEGERVDLLLRQIVVDPLALAADADVRLRALVDT